MVEKRRWNKNKNKNKKMKFSVEEDNGRRLDLLKFHKSYKRYSFGHPDMNYSDYLYKFPGFTKSFNFSKFKTLSHYTTYTQDLLDYLISFFNRTHPHTLLTPLLEIVELEFDVEWPRICNSNKRARPVPDPLLTATTTVETLMDFGLDSLRDALDYLGLRRGGTLRERADRLLLANTTPLHMLDPALLQDHTVDLLLRDAALLEAKIIKLCLLLSDALHQARSHHPSWLLRWGNTVVGGPDCCCASPST